MLARDLALAILPLALPSFAASQPLIGMAAPDIDFKDVFNLEGCKKLSDLQGRIVILDFFATW